MVYKDLKVGDKCIVKNLDIVGGENTYIGQEIEIVEVRTQDNFEGRFKDEIQYMFNRENLELIPKKIIKKAKKTMAKTKNKTLRLELQRKKDEVLFYIKIPNEIEAFFKKLSGNETETSSYWKDKEGKGLVFYKLTEEMKARLKQSNIGYDFINDYGNGLLADNSNNKINIAPLRTKNSSKGIWLHCNNITDRNIDFEYYLRELGVITKELYQNVIANKKVKAEIVFQF